MAVDNKYKYSKAYFKILKLIKDNPKENVFVIRGGQGASKTISITELIIQSLLSSEKEATILSSELSKMKRTVIRDYKKICKDWGVLSKDEDFNKSESKHEYPNGSYLDFLGADVVDVGKGFRRDILYINEADKMDIETAIQFISRAKLTIIDYNPDRLFWGDDFINENNFITLTFEDNEYLAESEVKSILDYKAKGFRDNTLPTEQLFNENNIASKYWANKWKVYGLGMVGALDGAIFNNWKVIPIVPLNAEFIAYGLDWGFTNDPTCLVAVYRWNGKLVLDELIYQSGLTNSQLVERFKQLNIRTDIDIIADSAEPKSIQDLCNAGYCCRPSIKGEDSIRKGIDVLLQFDILITERSINGIKEFESYHWATDKDGKTTGKPIDYLNHFIDPTRYVGLNKLFQNSYMEFL